MSPPPLLGAFRRRTRPAESEDAQAPAPAAHRRAAPLPSELRRERRALLQLREERIRDLGGLVLELVRRDSFRESLVLDRCDELLAIEGRLGEIEALLDVRRPPAAHCSCGAPIFWQSHFCGNCGRPVGTPTSCGSCGEPLAGDAGYCSKCGARTGAGGTA
jgi:uncharacterized protein YjiS (DUF1127 family)